MNNTARLAEIDRLHATLPRIDCKRLCSEACGPVVFTLVETRRLPSRPSFDRDTLTCGYLRGGECSVYAHRPTICRLFGLVKAMACPFGCEPERWMTDEEAATLMAKVEEIGKGWRYPDPHPLKITLKESVRSV